MIPIKPEPVSRNISRKFMLRKNPLAVIILFVTIITIVISPIYFIACVSLPGKGTNYNEVFRISAVGDIMMHAPQLAHAKNNRKNTYSFLPFFEEIKPSFIGSNLVIGNLETNLVSEELGYTGYPAFGSPAILASDLQNVGFNFLTTANNHSLDKDEIGLKSTLKELDGIGLKHTGSSYNKTDDRNKPFEIIYYHGLKIAIIAFTYDTNVHPKLMESSVNVIDKNEIAKTLALANTIQPDLVIVSFHFGNEYERDPSQEQIDIVDFTFQQGADLILGSHPHVLQRYEKKIMSDCYGIQSERLVIYSLGNFISSQQKRYTNGGIIFHVEYGFNKGKKPVIKSINIEPVYISISPDKGSHYTVVPVEKYYLGKTNLILNASDLKLMKEFYKDTCDLYHLEPKISHN